MAAVFGSFSSSLWVVWEIRGRKERMEGCLFILLVVGEIVLGGWVVRAVCLALEFRRMC